MLSLHIESTNSIRKKFFQSWLVLGEALECALSIREHSSILYLGMTMEISNLPLLCIAMIVAKDATKPKPSM